MTTTTSTTVPPTTTTAIPALAQPAPADLPPLGGPIGPGSSGPVVAAYEARLAALHFDPGTPDGQWTGDTTYAVQALQKLMQVPVSGTIGEPERQSLMGFRFPTPLVPAGEANRTEVDITHQTMTLYEGHQVRLITTVSTGGGQRYCYTPFDSNRRVCELALTPAGRFGYTWYVDGWHKSPLGQLYKPFYFNRGIAVHGYPSVPVRPASHGCVRVPMHIADYWHTLVHKGDPVYVVGDTAMTQVAAPVSTPRPPATTAPPVTTTAPPVTTAPPPTTTAPPTTTTAPPVTTTTPTTTTVAP